ncbi:MAG: isoprenylcysteine carboxylmethyltransferase family protein [Hyphomonas sp.]|nr:isoprenylcysteine carboxylmethyltransferase family protein [Hyphomonas sp.]
MLRALAILYSIACYAIGVAALVYLILFVAGLFVPVTVDVASPFAPDISGLSAALWDATLVAIWGAQHTFMASAGFKKWWTRYCPATIERSTYLIFVTLFTAGLVLFWAPLPATIWDVSGSPLGYALLASYFCGWTITLIATFLINHFHLFGLQQAWTFLRRTQSKTETFRTPFFYRIVRHPMMTGILISLWSVPTLTTGRLVFNVAMSLYIFIGIYFEEKTLVADLGEEYEAYRRRVPSVIPGLPAAAPTATPR